jgi:hypothetical protein
VCSSSNTARTIEINGHHSPKRAGMPDQLLHRVLGTCWPCGVDGSNRRDRNTSCKSCCCCDDLWFMEMGEHGVGDSG